MPVQARASCWAWDKPQMKAWQDAHAVNLLR